MLNKFAQKKNILYFCIVDNPWSYQGNVSTSSLLSETKTATVELFGQTVPAEVGAVRQLFCERRTPPEQQKELWMTLWLQWPDPEWGEICVAEAERMERLLRRMAAMEGGAGVPVQTEEAVARREVQRKVAVVPDSRLAERHFVWLGERHGLRVEHLRDGIEGLSRIGMIGSSRSQQEALRRGLGLTVNDVERQSDAPWVVWLGPADMLAHLVDSLWEMELITCAGGRQQKWRTATGMFLRADGTRYDLSLKNSRCTNAEKLALLERAFLGGLRFYLGR